VSRASDSKYYETPLYHLVYGELIDAARNRGTTTYQRVAELMGLPMQGSHMGREVGDIIGAISANEVEHERPMLSAVVVNVQGAPGEGFYAWAEELGRYSPADYANEKDFWNQEKASVYDAWKRQFQKG
jgi:hypothetical protein